jgi:hypothetical protein
MMVIMRKSNESLLWIYTILIVPAIIIITFWLNGYLRTN